MSFSPDYFLPDFEDSPLARASEIGFSDKLIDWFNDWKREKDNSDNKYESNY